MMGIRETRRFVKYTLTEQDYLEARVFNWAVTKAHFNFDVHNVSGSGRIHSMQKNFPTERLHHSLRLLCA